MKKLLVLALLLVGCRKGTSVLVRIDQGDVAIPSDVAALQIEVTNPEISTTPTYQSQVLTLCGSKSQVGCTSFPITLALKPGSDTPDALVRVEVTALDSSSATVIHDAAEFHFASGQQSMLDFFLSKACLMSECAASNQLCGRNGGCVMGSLGTSMTPDLATSGGTITRWTENSDTASTGTIDSWVMPRPANAQVGDLLVAMTIFGDPPSGWTTVVAQAGERLVYRRIGEAETDLDYTFGGDAASQAGWLYALYRGVSSVQVGGIATSGVDATLVFPSMEAPAGSFLTTWLMASSLNGCSQGGRSISFASQSSGLDEIEISTAGPTGARTYACAENTGEILGAQLLLVP